MNSKRGVSLIVLAITVIIMVILASAVVLTLRDSADMIGNAKTGVNESDKQTIQTAVNTLYTKMMMNVKESITLVSGGPMEDGKLTFCVTGDESKVITKKKVNGVEQFAIAEEGDTPYTLSSEDLGISADRLKDFNIDKNGVVSLITGE